MITTKEQAKAALERLKAAVPDGARVMLIVCYSLPDDPGESHVAASSTLTPLEQIRLFRAALRQLEASAPHCYIAECTDPPLEETGMCERHTRMAVD